MLFKKNGIKCLTRNEVAAESTLKAIFIIMAFNYNPIMDNGNLCMQFSPRFFVGFYAA